jgi:hypothetical protein
LAALVVVERFTPLEKRHARVVPIAALLLKKNEKPCFSARNVVLH